MQYICIYVYIYIYMCIYIYIYIYKRDLYMHMCIYTFIDIPWKCVRTIKGQDERTISSIRASGTPPPPPNVLLAGWALNPKSFNPKP